MRWINVYGLVMIAVILVPNIVFAIKCKDGFDNMWHSRFVSAAEQIGRFSCFALMIFNIPGMYVWRICIRECTTYVSCDRRRAHSGILPYMDYLLQKQQYVQSSSADICSGAYIIKLQKRCVVTKTKSALSSP